MHTVEPYKREDGKHAWRIKVGDDVVATDGGQGYENRKDMLQSFFGLYFGKYDESFMDLYDEWRPHGAPSTPEEVADERALNSETGVTTSDDITRGGLPGGEARSES
jgi:hypothetical protein